MDFKFTLKRINFHFTRICAVFLLAAGAYIVLNSYSYIDELPLKIAGIILGCFFGGSAVYFWRKNHRPQK